MGICTHCGSAFPKTRKSRKYCTSRCRTNACLSKRPRLKQSDVDALYALVGEEFVSAAEMRARLRAILLPDEPAVPVVNGYMPVPRLD